MLSYGCTSIWEASGALHGHHEEEHLTLRGTAGEDVRLQHGSDRSWAVGVPHPGAFSVWHQHLPVSHRTHTENRHDRTVPAVATSAAITCGRGHLENLKVSTKGWVEVWPAPPLCSDSPSLNHLYWLFQPSFHIFGSKWHVSPTI